MLNEKIGCCVQIVRGVVIVILFCAAAWALVTLVNWLVGG